MRHARRAPGARSGSPPRGLRAHASPLLVAWPTRTSSPACRCHGMNTSCAGKEARSPSGRENPSIQPTTVSRWNGRNGNAGSLYCASENNANRRGRPLHLPAPEQMRPRSARAGRRSPSTARAPRRSPPPRPERATSARCPCTTRAASRSSACRPRARTRCRPAGARRARLASPTGRARPRSAARRKSAAEAASPRRASATPAAAHRPAASGTSLYQGSGAATSATPEHASQRGTRCR